MQRIAVTGGTGFLGKRLIQALLDGGYSVSALTRRPQTSVDGLTWHLGDMHSPDALKSLLDSCDGVIHCAGLTKALCLEDYMITNEKGTKRLLEATSNVRSVKRFIQVSSLAAREPDISDYGASKAAADRHLKFQDWPFETCIVRPPAVYGPGDTELLKAIKLANGTYGLRLFPAPSGLAGKAGFIHVDDLVAALIALLTSPLDQQIMEIDDGHPGGYQAHEIAAAMTLDPQKPPKIFALPSPLRYLIGGMGDAVATMTEKPSKIMSEQLAYLAHDDWSVHEENRAKIAGWSPRYDLSTGMQQTLDWYRAQGLIR